MKDSKFSMLVKTLDEIEYEWEIPEKIAKGNKRNCSNEHIRARNLLINHYPNVRIYEEIPFFVESKKRLYLDFYIPVLRTAIEVHGEQHYSFNSHFFRNKLMWLKAKQNDVKKVEWCSINSISLIEFPHYENDDIWMERLLS